MADFCKQCSIEIFGEDYEELALPKDSDKRGTLKDGEGWLALCEGCGGTVVDDDGVCISPHCEKHGSPKE